MSSRVPHAGLYLRQYGGPGQRGRQTQQSPLDYALLADQNTRPRATYEARIRNPKPSNEGSGG